MSDRKLEQIDPDIAVLERAFATFSEERRWIAGGDCETAPDGTPRGCLLWHLSWAAGIPGEPSEEYGHVLDYGNPRLEALVRKLGFADHKEAYQWNDRAVYRWGRPHGEYEPHAYLTNDLRARVTAYRNRALARSRVTP